MWRLEEDDGTEVSKNETPTREVSDWSIDKHTSVVPSITNTIEVPASQTVVVESIPYEEPDVITGPPPTEGLTYSVDIPSTPSLPASLGIQDTIVFTQEQLKNLKSKLISLCKTNAKSGLDGQELRDRLVSILNTTLDLSIAANDPNGLNVIYHIQVSPIILSIDTVTCEDKNPAIP